MSYQDELPTNNLGKWLIVITRRLIIFGLGLFIGAGLILAWHIKRDDFGRGMKGMEDIVKLNPGFCLQVKSDDKRLRDK